MKRNWWKPLVILFIVGNLFTCIDPYSPKLDDFQSLLVVNALLTDENKSNIVSLSHTIKTADDKPEMVSGALVIIKDDLGNSTTLNETSTGIYKTDSLIFRGEIGRSYTLYIKTVKGEEYESEPCLMYPLQDIDSIYFEKDQEIVDNETQEGIRIFIDSKGESDCNYYRWTYEEWWKFSVPNPKKYEYLGNSRFAEYFPLKQVCWANRKSDAINIKTTETGTSNKFDHKPVLFIATDKSNRLLIRYNICVKQYSISKKEYEFWNQLSQINETGGDIFDKQPFQIVGNIHNKSRPDEQVLGYFQVSGAKVKNRYISSKEVAELDVPSFRYDCVPVALGPQDFPPDERAQTPPPSFDQIYAWYNGGNSIFVRPLYDNNGKLKRLEFATPLCSDCTLSGRLTKPDFWVDSD